MIKYFKERMAMRIDGIFGIGRAIKNRMGKLKWWRRFGNSKGLGIFTSIVLAIKAGMRDGFGEFVSSAADDIFASTEELIESIQANFFAIGLDDDVAEFLSKHRAVFEEEQRRNGIDGWAQHREQEIRQHMGDALGKVEDFAAANL